MQFNGERTSFGRHETFPLRYSWITKGVQYLYRHGDQPETKVLKNDDCIVELGVGKNMVSSIRYWLLATRMLEKEGNFYKLTDLGKSIFLEKGWDPYLEDEATIWLLHWQLASNPEISTTWFWFFNCFHKQQFPSQDVQHALTQYCQDRVPTKVAATTLKNDAAVLLRMYAQSAGTTKVPLEEALDSPMAELQLINKFKGSKNYQSLLNEKPMLPLNIFTYAVAKMFEFEANTTLSVSRLMYGDNTTTAVGSVFRLSEVGLMYWLERMSEAFPDIFELRESAGINQVFLLKACDPTLFLEMHYTNQAKEMAA